MNLVGQETVRWAGDLPNGPCLHGLFPGDFQEGKRPIKAIGESVPLRKAKITGLDQTYGVPLMGLTT